MANNPTRGLLLPQAAADYLGVSLPTLYRLAHQRVIPVCHVGRLLRIPIQGLDDWIEAHTTAPIPERRVQSEGRKRHGLSGDVVQIEEARRKRSAS